MQGLGLAECCHDRCGRTLIPCTVVVLYRPRDSILVRFSGASSEYSTALRSGMKGKHDRWHIFFIEQRLRSGLSFGLFHAFCHALFPFEISNPFAVNISIRFNISLVFWLLLPRVQYGRLPLIHIWPGFCQGFARVQWPSSWTIWARHSQKTKKKEE